MELKPIDPRRIAAELRAQTYVSRLSPPRWLVRKVLPHMPEPQREDVHVVQVRAGEARMRAYSPATGAAKADGVLLWIHGGGYVVGDARQDGELCSDLVAALGIVVVSVNYRLAPEHPFPVALNDVLAAWDWVQERSGAGTRIAVGGSSAGGGLAVCLTQRLMDRGGAVPDAQWLFAPMLDDRTAANRALDALKNPIHDNVANEDGWRSYLGVEPGGDVPPYAVGARREDLTGTPPTYIVVGDIDLFHDEDASYVDRLQAAGAEAVLHEAPGLPHGWESWGRSARVVQPYIQHATAWLGQKLAATDGASGDRLSTGFHSMDETTGV